MSKIKDEDGVILNITYNRKTSTAQLGIYTEDLHEHSGLVSALATLLTDHPQIYVDVIATMEERNGEE